MNAPEQADEVEKRYILLFKYAGQQFPTVAAKFDSEKDANDARGRLSNTLEAGTTVYVDIEYPDEDWADYCRRLKPDSLAAHIARGDER